MDVKLSTILKTANDSEIGFVFQVDLDDPDALHNMHKGFPLAPTKEKIDRHLLSEYQLGLLDQACNRRVTTPKLVQTLFAKKKYTVHYVTLKLYVILGVKVTKLDRVLQFKQEKWLEPYFSLNTKMRTESKNKFEESFYKRMNNPSYGKTLESNRNRVNIKPVKTREAVLENSDKGLLKSINIFDQNPIAITSRRGQISWDTPTLVGVCILDLAKFHIKEFHKGKHTMSRSVPSPPRLKQRSWCIFHRYTLDPYSSGVQPKWSRCYDKTFGSRRYPFLKVSID